MFASIYQYLASSEGSRIIATAGIIIQSIGIIVPAMIASLTYVRSTRTKTVEGVIEQLRAFSNPDENTHFLAARKSLDKFNLGVISISEITSKPKKLVPIISLLNRLEFYAMYVNAAGNNSHRMNAAKKYSKSTMIDYWELGEKFIKSRRIKKNQPNFMGEFEKMVFNWRKTIQRG
jgi:hypothetical protein